MPLITSQLPVLMLGSSLMSGALDFANWRVLQVRRP
jgi:hypothetical protein